METQGVQAGFGLAEIWARGDGVGHFVALLLIMMSVVTWAVIVLKALALRKVNRLGAQCEPFWHSANFEEGVKALGPEHDNPFRQLAERGQEAISHLTPAPTASASAQLHDQLDVSDWVERALTQALDDASNRLQSGLTILASVGSTAPFVGLFGTVWGIYHALMGISSGGGMAIQNVAGPIGEALIMTALGLAVAIPAVLGYNALLRGNKAVIQRLNRFAHELHGYFVTGARVGGSFRHHGQ